MKGSPVGWSLVFFFLFFPLLTHGGEATRPGQNESVACWVFFSDKKETLFDAHDYFHPAAIARRLNHGLEAYDSLDLPVNQDYLQQVNQVVDTIRMVSRWFNAARVMAGPLQIVQLEEMPFVRKVLISTMQTYPALVDSTEGLSTELSAEWLLKLNTQVRSMEGLLFHQNDVDGKGIRIAIFDGGFPAVDTHPAFSHLIKDNRIVATWDFHRNRENVFDNMAHGTQVLSVLGGRYHELPMGLATGAQYLLARTEMWREPFFEEEYWLAAMEWADRHGAHIINSSLGYSYQRYFPEDMDGETSLVAQAAAIAFSKGMLVVNSAGNSGVDVSWRIVSTPADAPQVLTVGALSYPELLAASYSSRGPTADGRMKPNLSAMGNVVAAAPQGYTDPSGSSFSSPLIAGFAACVWQMHPQWTNQQLFEALEQSGHLYPYYDFDQGHGLPRAGYFFSPPGTVQYRTFEFVVEQQALKVKLRNIIAEKQQDDPLNNYLYYHIQNASGELEQYFVVLARQQEVLSLTLDDFQPGQKVMVHYRGFTSAWTF